MVVEPPKDVVPVKPEPEVQVSLVPVALGVGDKCLLGVLFILILEFQLLGHAWASIPHSNGDLGLWASWPLSGVFGRHSAQCHQGCGCRRLRQPHALQRIREGHLQVPETTWGHPPHTPFLTTNALALSHSTLGLTLFLTSPRLSRMSDLLICKARRWRVTCEPFSLIGLCKWA